MTGGGPSSNDGLKARLEKLTPAQQALLERRLLAAQSGSVDRQPIRRRAVVSPCPMSYAQELMWLLDQVTAVGNAYNTPWAYRLTGPLDVGALRQALTALVERHEILRTTYQILDGQPMQIIGPPTPVELTTIDLSDGDREQQDVDLQRLVSEEAQRPFDLAAGPVMRSTLIRLGEDDHVFVSVEHHIAIDGWSKAVLIRDLEALYDQYAYGSPAELPTLPFQYADYAVWQREWLQGDVLERQVAYWKKQLGDAPPRLELPTDHPSPAVRTFRGDNRRLVVEPELLERLGAVTQETGGTLFMGLLATLAVLLQRYTGQDDVVIGTPFIGRTRTDVEGLIGYFTNTLALRVDLSGDPTFRELVGRTRQVTLDAFAHGDVPFERVVRSVNPERDLSQMPIFQVMMVLHNPDWKTQRPQFEPRGTTAVQISHEKGWAKFDLTLGMSERREGLNTTWEYSTELFDEATIARMMEHFRELLQSAVANPDQAISRLVLLTGDERREVLSMGRASIEAAGGDTLHGLFEHRARLTPDAVAVESSSGSLTYGQLHQESDRLARHLASLGVGPGVPVGICSHGSLYLLVGLLGILKAGGACAPLDPQYPPDRLNFMVTDLQAPVVLTDREHVPALSAAEAQIVCLDDEWGESDAGPLDVSVTTDDPAYVVYTSGSTGRPRGVLLTHRGLVAHARAAIDQYGITTADRVLQFSSISFDISIEEIFPTLAVGGTVVLREPDTPIAGSPFVDWIAEQRLTVLSLPTAFWHAWTDDLERLGNRVPECLRIVIVGGEKASAQAYQMWLARDGARVRWMNTYGPTETSIVASAYEPPANWSVGAELPIGGPFGCTNLYVLDRSRELVPIGVPGELFIGGVGVAQGYHGRPELTSEKFSSDPFAESPAARMYQTGDIVRWLSDGNLEYVGRTDDQIKVRGFRVEPGEIEAALEAHPSIAEAVVVPLRESGDVRLVAYAKRRRSQEDTTAEDLRSWLAERLPGYMVPAACVLLDSLPLTPNGKVDRDALPAPAPPATASTVEPRDDIERRLVEIWREVLTLDGLGVTDDFFALGGHSLQAVQVFSEIEGVFGIRLPLVTFLQGATIEHLANAIRREESAARERSPLVPSREGASGPPHTLRGKAARVAKRVRALRS